MINHYYMFTATAPLCEQNSPPNLSFIRIAPGLKRKQLPFMEVTKETRNSVSRELIHSFITHSSYLRWWKWILARSRIRQLVHFMARLHVQRRPPFGSTSRLKNILVSQYLTDKQMIFSYSSPPKTRSHGSRGWLMPFLSHCFPGCLISRMTVGWMLRILDHYHSKSHSVMLVGSWSPYRNYERKFWTSLENRTWTIALNLSFLIFLTSAVRMVDEDEIEFSATLIILTSSYRLSSRHFWSGIHWHRWSAGCSLETS